MCDSKSGRAEPRSGKKEGRIEQWLRVEVFGVILARGPGLGMGFGDSAQNEQLRNNKDE